MKKVKRDAFCPGLSNRRVATLYLNAAHETITHYGTPEISNTDKAVNSPAASSPDCSRSMASRSAWTARAAGATTYNKLLAENRPFRWANARIRYSNWKAALHGRLWPISSIDNHEFAAA